MQLRTTALALSILWLGTPLAARAEKCGTRDGANPTLTNVTRLVAREPAFARDALQPKAIERILDPEFAAANPYEARRRLYADLAHRDPNARELLARAAREDLHEGSDRLQRDLTSVQKVANQVRDFQTYDIVVVGGGGVDNQLHAAWNAIPRRAQKTLTIHPAAELTEGSGLASDMQTLSRAAAEAPVLFKRTVVRVEPSWGPGMTSHPDFYRVVMDDGTMVYSKQVIFADHSDADVARIAGGIASTRTMRPLYFGGVDAGRQLVDTQGKRHLIFRTRPGASSEELKWLAMRTNRRPGLKVNPFPQPDRIRLDALPTNPNPESGALRFPEGYFPAESSTTVSTQGLPAQDLRLPKGTEDLYLDSRVLKVLRRYDMPAADGGFRIRFSRTDQGNLAFSTSPPLVPASLRAVTQEIESDPDLVRLVQARLQGSDAPQTLSFRLGLEKPSDARVTRKLARGPVQTETPELLSRAQLRSKYGKASPEADQLLKRLGAMHLTDREHRLLGAALVAQADGQELVFRRGTGVYDLLASPMDRQGPSITAKVKVVLNPDGVSYSLKGTREVREWRRGGVTDTFEVSLDRLEEALMPDFVTPLRDVVEVTR